MKEKIKHIILENEIILRQIFKIKNLALYGSIIKNNYSENSDIDFVVSFYCPVGSKYIELIMFLNSILPLSVDLITQNGTRVIFYNQIVSDLEFILNDNKIQ